MPAHAVLILLQIIQALQPNTADCMVILGQGGRSLFAAFHHFLPNVAATFRMPMSGQAAPLPSALCGKLGSAESRLGAAWI